MGWLPIGLSLHNWQAAFATGSLVPRWFFNSLFVATTISILTLFFDSMAGYTFARKKFPGRDFLFLTVIFCITVPFAVLLIPIYSMMAKTHLINTYLALIAPAASPLGVFMMRQSIFSIPPDFDEAAKLDGCSEFGIFWRIILPLSRPALASVFIITFVTQWNWFIYPFIVTNKNEMFTLTVALYTAAETASRSLFPPEWGIIMVLITITFIPLLAVFLGFQEYFTKGMVMTGLK
ncbi:MAG: carbohydrate ABC transporter permease [Bacteroidetes bacterium]|nr:carbohydrate ABC transporter permease [Bacteroidota bacterium]